MGTDAYGQIGELAKEVSLLSSMGSLLSWDQEIFLPKHGLPFRAEQQAYLSGTSHRLWTDPKTGEMIEEALSQVDHGSDEEVNLVRWKRDFERASCLPVELVEKSAREEAKAHEAWKSAREANQFSMFSESLETLIEIAKEKANHWGYEDSPYDALLEIYEPGLKVRDLNPLFGQVASELTSICEKAFRQEQPEPLPPGPYPLEKQKELNRKVAEAVGFDFERGRMDVSVHPFSSGMGPHDNRITTRYDEADFTSSLSAILHEAGHGMYEQGLNPDAFATPLGESVSLGIHESQSRFWENQIGRSEAFWQSWYPTILEYFPSLQGYGPEKLAAFVNQVQRSFIRVDASEIGYDLHVILRFEVEEKIFSGELKVDEVPIFWNDRFKEMIGLEVPDDAHGCLQDIHWSMGGFGYFPTYTLGSINAAMLYEAVTHELGDLAPYVAKQDYAPIQNFLKEKIHRQGRRYLPNELIEFATGSKQSARPMLNYFAKKVG
ncbi:MAG: carboxypeptidase M32 [Verrucomicrobiota bacterium]